MISRDGGRVQAPSHLTIETVIPLFKNGLQATGETSLVVDLAQVVTVDSAAVSLLLAWLREAHIDIGLIGQIQVVHHLIDPGVVMT